MIAARRLTRRREPGDARASPRDTLALGHDAAAVEHQQLGEAVVPGGGAMRRPQRRPTRPGGEDVRAAQAPPGGVPRS